MFRLDEKVAREIIKPMRSMRNSGDDADSTGLRREAGAALIACAQSEAHARAIVAEIRRYLSFYPTVNVIYEMAEAVPPPVGMKGPEASCGLCQGTGFQRILNQDAVRFCDCRKERKA